MKRPLLNTHARPSAAGMPGPEIPAIEVQVSVRLKSPRLIHSPDAGVRSVLLVENVPASTSGPIRLRQRDALLPMELRASPDLTIRPEVLEIHVPDSPVHARRPANSISCASEHRRNHQRAVRAVLKRRRPPDVHRPERHSATPWFIKGAARDQRHVPGFDCHRRAGAPRSCRLRAAHRAPVHTRLELTVSFSVPMRRSGSCSVNARIRVQRRTARRDDHASRVGKPRGRPVRSDIPAAPTRPPRAVCKAADHDTSRSIAPASTTHNSPARPSRLLHAATAPFHKAHHQPPLCQTDSPAPAQSSFAGLSAPLATRHGPRPPNRPSLASQLFPEAAEIRDPDPARPKPARSVQPVLRLLPVEHLVPFFDQVCLMWL